MTPYPYPVGWRVSGTHKSARFTATVVATPGPYSVTTDDG
jgi:hypothetical protein